MKDLLVSVRPSYEHVLMELSLVLLYFFFSDESQREMLPFHFLSLSFLSPEWAVGSEQTEKDTLDLFSLQSVSPTAFQFLYPFSPTCVGGGRGDYMKLWTTQLSPPSCVSSSFTFSPCLPFVPLSSPGVNVLFPTILTIPLHCPIYLVTMATWETLLCCTKRDFSSPSRVVQ